MEKLPEDVRAFLQEHVGDYEELEVLLHLVRAPERAWTEGELQAELEMRDAPVGPAIARLAEGGLAEVDGETRTVRYRPADADLDRRVRLLSRAYAETPLSVIRFMNRMSLDRLRTSAVRAFSDAFRIRGPKDDG